MNKRLLFLALGTLLLSLLSGAAASGSAQTPMTGSYVWQPYGLTVSYPADWTVVEKTSAISLRPEGRDVTDGRGPEMVLFDVPGVPASNLQGAMMDVASGTGATTSTITRSTLDGHSTFSTSLTWTNPDATGRLMLIAVDLQTVVGVAYVVRTTEAADYLPVLEAMRDSLTFPDRAETTPGAESSSSVASVQLPQPYVWEQTGLVLHLPDNWKVDFQQDVNGDTLVATPDPATARGDDIYRVLQGFVLTNADLNTVALVSSGNYQNISTFVDTTVAGQPGITYDAYDATSDLAVHFRPLFVALPDGRIAALVFSTRDTGWDQFRPAVSAMISSITLASADTAARTTTRTLVARTASLPAQDTPTPEPQPFVWEEFGISFVLPDGWTSRLGNGQDYDLALISPEADQSNGNGAYITLLSYPGLATAGNTFEAALQPIADQLKADIQTRTINGLEVTYITTTDETQGVDHQFILVPYGTKGDAIYILTTTPTAGGDEVIQGIIDSMVVNVIEPDVAAVDAAWQTSLADQGRLIVGDPNAPIKMREYLSFTCPHCVHYSRTIERLIALDVQTGRVQYEFAPLLLNPGDTYAQNATEATYCAAEQGKGYSASEALFQAYLEQTPQVAYTPDGIKQALAPLGLDMDAFNTCMNEGRYLDKLTTIGTEFSDQGLTGTPTVTLGQGDNPPEPIVLPDGQVWSGTIPLQLLHEIFHAVIDEGMTIQEYFQQ